MQIRRFFGANLRPRVLPRVPTLDFRPRSEACGSPMWRDTVLKYLIPVALLIALAGCATAPATPTPATAATPSWRVSRSIAVDGPDLVRFCVAKTDDKWNQSEPCNVKQNNVEIVYVDPWHRLIFLGASAPRPQDLSTLEKRNQQYRQGEPVDSWECYYGAFGTADRTKHGYTVCSSALTKGATGAGEAVIGNLANALFGTIRKRVAVDTDAVDKVVQDANLIPDSYRRAFATAKTSSDFDRFIQRYRNDDPDHLVPKANEALAQARQAEDAARAEAQAETQQLQVAYEKQRVADERARVAQARERETRITHWRQTVKVGDGCWVGPRKLGYTRGMMHALVVEIKPTIVRVQYDGRTSTYYVVDLPQREEWVKTAELYPEGEYSYGTGTVILKPNM